MRSFLILVAILSLPGCTTLPVGNLNDPVRAQQLPDTAPIPGYRARQLPYEWQTHEGVSVAYNLRLGFLDDGTSVYWLRLIIKNETSDGIRAAPQISVVDASGLALAPYSYDGFTNYLAAVGSAPITVASIPTASSSDSTARSYFHSGTAVSSSGTVYSYSGTTQTAPNTSSVDSFSDGFTRGFNQAQAIKANKMIQQQHQARAMLNWSDAYWLRSNYAINSSEAVAGVLIFPAERTLPLKVTVDVSGRPFVFLTADSISGK